MAGIHTCTFVFSLNRLNKLCWSMTENKTESRWSKSHELKLITRLEDLLSLHFTMYHTLVKQGFTKIVQLQRDNNKP